MHKDATIVQREEMDKERDFEERFGRKMTPEEKSLLSLSDEFLSASEAGNLGSNLVNFTPRRRQGSSRKKAA